MLKGEAVGSRGRRGPLFPGSVACLALLALSLPACGDDQDGSGKGPGAGRPAKSAITVNIASFKFGPDPITVKAGGKVTWVNQDKAPHTAQTSADAKPGFDTDRLDLGEKASVAFDRPGRLSYYCVYHRFMTGTVEVVE